MLPLATSLIRVAHRHLKVKPVRRLLSPAFDFLTRSRTVTLTAGGLTFQLDLGEYIDRAVYLDNYEPDLRDAIYRLCPKDAVVMDIGANIGAHALHFAKAVGSGGKVYAFEPTDFAFRKLLRNVSLNPSLNLVPVQVALANRTRPAQEIHFRSSWRLDGKHVESATVVDFQTLDGWCAQNGISSVDVIKLDVDGNEVSVLQGATQLLDSCHPILLIEAWGMNSAEERDPITLLSKRGYHFYDLTGQHEYSGGASEVRALITSPTGTPLDYSINILAVRGPE